MDSSEGEGRCGGKARGVQSGGGGCDVRGREKGKREPRLDYGPAEPGRGWGEGGSGRRV
ncbi:hypothetical protein WH47_01356 [Habropoda laboriosa]|uniref:Uncharacterized protein n=1 Tax=Habropoda laboriosa TaxID=597456 RepID=A0A0L7R354_9HYME|nr:hypothetical protein WH47_01356 [Habropoda laboriosa]